MQVPVEVDWGKLHRCSICTGRVEVGAKIDFEI